MYIKEGKEKYRGMFEIQKSGDKTSSGEIGLDIRTHASPKVGQDQVSGGVSVLCWHAAPVAYVLKMISNFKHDIYMHDGYEQNLIIKVVGVNLYNASCQHRTSLT